MVVPNTNANSENFTLTTIFQPRAEFSSIVYKGRIYIIAGANDKEFYNDVWTMNFYNPNRFDLRNPGGRKAKYIFSPRYSQQALLHNNELYVMGGFTNEPVGQLMCDVWKMEDDNGNFWTRLAVDAWDKKGRIEFGAVSYNNEMYVMGGYGGKATLSTKIEMK